MEWEPPRGLLHENRAGGLVYATCYGGWICAVEHNHRQGAASCTEPGHSTQRAVKSSHGLGHPW